MNTRAKWAYLPYDSIQPKIDEGILDQFDVIYTSDSHENVIITPDLTLWSVKSRIYTFDSVADANTALNTNTDTYKGQIVSILNGDKYTAYVVNQDSNGVYSATTLSAENVNYNNLGNRPIENLVGTLDVSIIVENLDTGMYKIKGQYKIYNGEDTVYLSADGDLFIVEISATEKFIKRFTKKTIQDFVISDGEIKKNTYITEEYLADNGYSTNDYVDVKLTAFETSIKNDIESYVEQTVEDIIINKVDAIIDERLDVKLDERIQISTNEEVEDFFK